MYKINTSFAFVCRFAALILLCVSSSINLNAATEGMSGVEYSVMGGGTPPNFIEGKNLQKSGDRFAVVKDIIKDHIDTHQGEIVTNETHLPALMQLWHADFAFVKAEIEKQDGQHVKTITKKDGTTVERPIPVRLMRKETLERMDAVNKQVKKDFQNGDMSFRYLMCAWEYMSSNVFFSHQINDQGSDRKPPSTSSIKENAQNNYFFKASPTNILITHVCKEGHLSIHTLNDGLAFKVNDIIYFASFFGIGTNQILEFDGVRNQNVSTLFSHDNLHWVWAAKERFGKSKIDENQSMYQLKEKIARIYSQPNVQYALYELYHEWPGESKPLSIPSNFLRILPDKLKEYENSRFDLFSENRIRDINSLLPPTGKLDENDGKRGRDFFISGLKDIRDELIRQSAISRIEWYYYDRGNACKRNAQEEINTHTTGINALLSNLQKLSHTKRAAPAEQKIILKAIMATVLLHTDEAAEAFHLSARLPAGLIPDSAEFRHFEIICMTESFTEKLRAKQEITESEYETFQTYSGIDQETFMAWYKEAKSEHGIQP